MRHPSRRTRKPCRPTCGRRRPEGRNRPAEPGFPQPVRSQGSSQGSHAPPPPHRWRGTARPGRPWRSNTPEIWWFSSQLTPDRAKGEIGGRCVFVERTERTNSRRITTHAGVRARDNDDPLIPYTRMPGAPVALARPGIPLPVARPGSVSPGKTSTLPGDARRRTPVSRGRRGGSLGGALTLGNILLRPRLRFWRNWDGGSENIIDVQPTILLDTSTHAVLPQTWT